MDFDLTELAVVAAVFAVAGAVKGVIGLGLPTISMGLLGALMPPTRAAAILVIPTLLTNVWQMWSGPALLALLKRLWPMLLTAVLGTVMTAGILTRANARVTTALLGCVLMVYCVVGLAGWRFKVRRASEPWLAPLIGLATGFINGATGIFVIPGVPYLQAIELDKDELVQALALSAFISTVALALGLGINSSLGFDIAAPTLVALAAAFAGMAIGQVARETLSVDAFRRWVFIGLFALGATMVARFVW